MDNTVQQSLNQTQSPSRYEEVERVRQRMDELRKHHIESTDIHNRTQPIINEQIHEETLRYLKNGQANGTKTKSQKPRVPKRQRNATANQTTTPATPVITSNTNGHPPQPQIQQAPLPSSPIIGQSNIYPPRMQQQHPTTIHMQQPQQHTHPHPQQQQHYAQQQRFMYQQPQQPSMQAQLKPPQQIYSHHQQPMHQPSHMDPQYITQSYSPHSLYHQNHHHLNHHHHHHHIPSNHVNHAPFTTLPNDLDLNLQAGLECDVDSLIKHEMSVEGQLDFNHDLIQRILF